MQRVQIEAARRDHSFSQAQLPRVICVDPKLLSWRRLIDHAVADAKKTTDGLPTDHAILARWWISDLRPTQADRDNWERCFECACCWLDLDADKERQRLLKQIDDALLDSCLSVVRKECDRLRTGLLSFCGTASQAAHQLLLCAGFPDIHVTRTTSLETLRLFPVESNESLSTDIETEWTPMTIAPVITPGIDSAVTLARASWVHSIVGESLAAT
jgi:hypothetical protein